MLVILNCADGVALRTLSQARVVTGLTAGRALDALADVSLREVIVRTEGKAVVVQEEKVLRAGRRSAVFGNVHAGNAASRTRLTDVWNADRNELSVRTSLSASVLVHVLVVDITPVYSANCAEIKSKG